MARIYILPTLSMGMFTDLDGIAGIGIFRDGSEKGAPLGTTTRSTFVAFDLPPGTYDLMAYNGPVTKFTKSMTFASDTVYFLRPAFFRSSKDLSKVGSGAESAGNGMMFEPVSLAAGSAEIQRMDMAPLRPRGQAFLTQAATQLIPAPAYVAPANPPVPDTSFHTVEQKLADLQKLYREGLISQTEYDSKRQAILNAY